MQTVARFTCFDARSHLFRFDPVRLVTSRQALLAVGGTEGLRDPVFVLGEPVQQLRDKRSVLGQFARRIRVDESPELFRHDQRKRTSVTLHIVTFEWNAGGIPARMSRTTAKYAVAITKF